MTINWLLLMLYLFMSGHLLLAVILLGRFLSQTFSLKIHQTMRPIYHNQAGESHRIIYSRNKGLPLYSQMRSASLMR